MNPYNLQVGDLVTSYYDGVWEIITIDQRWEHKVNRLDYAMGDKPSDDYKEYSPLVTIQEKYNSDGVKPKKARVKQCDIQFCKPYKEEVEKWINTMEKRIKALKKIL